MDVTPAPRPPDVALSDPAADREVRVEAVPARMPLGRPQVREALANRTAQPTKEVGQVDPERGGIVVARSGVG